MISSRDVNDLLPEVAVLCWSFIEACKKEGIDVIITSTYRDFASQSALYAQGRTSPGHIVTNAKAGESFHNYRVAFDFAPVVNGKVPWNDSDLFTCCGVIGENVGLEWAGRWKHMRELAHLQLKGQTLTTLRAEAHA